LKFSDVENPRKMGTFSIKVGEISRKITEN
jgi:hypothetical protein